MKVFVLSEKKKKAGDWNNDKKGGKVEWSKECLAVPQGRRQEKPDLRVLGSSRIRPRYGLYLLWFLIPANNECEKKQ